MKPTKCNLCGSKNTRIYLVKQDMCLSTCDDCGLIFMDPQFELDYEEDYFENYGEKSYLQKAKSKALSSVNFLKKLEKYVPEKGTLLEVGCATGFLLEQARKRGWRVYGVEKSNWARKYAREKLSLDVYEHIKEVPENVDAVIMLNTIEHFESPRKCINDISFVLKKQGILFLTTPNFNDARFLFNHKNNIYIEKQHNYYFTIPTIKLLLKEYEILKINCPFLTRMADNKVVKSDKAKAKVMSNPLFGLIKKIDNSKFGTTIELTARLK